MKRILYIAAFMAGTGTLWAQTTATLRVVDAVSHQPLSGATVSVGNRSTTTASDGSFSIQCGTTRRITVSFVGYEPAQQVLKDCQDIIIALTPFSQSLNAVEITATSSNNKSLLYQPMSITKLNRAEIRRGTSLFLDDAINTNVPGVTMSRRSLSGGQQFNIRGYGNGVRGTNGPNSNFDGQGYKVYLNGIPVTDAEGITLMDDIDFGSIGNVEVLKGPSGTLYGLAIAGVVNLHTLKPEKGKTSLVQDVLLGSYGLRRYTTHFQAGGERSSLLLNYGYQEADGYMVHTASKKKFINLAGDFQPSEKQELSFTAGYSDSYDERGGELTLAQYANRDYSGNPAYIQRNAHSGVVSFRLGVGHTYHFTDALSNTTTVYGSGMTSNASSAAGWTDKTPVNYGLRSSINTKLPLGNSLTLTGMTGIEAQRQHAQVIGYFMKPAPEDPTGYYKIDTMRSNQAYITATKSLFTEWTLSLPRDVSVTAGLGWSTMNIDLADRFVRPNYTRPQHYEQAYRAMVSPHLAINKVFSNELSVYASYSTGYKAPVSSYFFVPVSTSVGFVDSTLKPEKGSQVEVGSKGALWAGKLVYQLSLFRALFSDKMTAVAVPLNPPAVGTAYSYVANGGKQDHRGLELSVKYTAFESEGGLLRGIRPFANLTYSDFKYQDYTMERLKTPATGDTTFTYSGNPVAGVAPFTANLGVDLQAEAGLYANAVYNFKDAMPVTSDNAVRTTSYSLLNAKLGIRRSLSRHFEVDAYVGVNNITGTQYPLMVFINQLPDAYLPAPDKANYFGGLQLKYNL